MKPSVNVRRGLRLEPLEARTLLAGGLLSGGAALQEVEAAISGTGEFKIRFDSYQGNVVSISGSSEVDLVVDFEKLPDHITRITLSSFDEVTFLGNEHVQTLTVRQTTSVDGAGISVGDLKTDHVSEVTLAATTGSIASFSGSETRVAIGDIEDTMLITGVDKLSLLSKSERVYVMFTRQDQTVQFEYHPAQVDASGAEDWKRQMLFPEPPSEPNQPQEPSPDSDKVVIVFHLADEGKIKFLLNQLENNQALSKLAPDQLMLELDRAQAFDGYEAFIASAHATDNPVEREENLGEELQVFSGLSEFTEAGSDLPTLGQLELASLERTDIKGSPSVVLSEFKWAETPVAFKSIQAASANTGEASGAAAPVASAEELYGLYVVDFGRSNRSLGDYLLERFSAELRPGNQTAVLLIDPKPSRSAGISQRESAFDDFA